MIDSILRPIASQLVNVSATTAQSAADFSEMTVAIELYATQAMFVRFSSPTGTDTAAVGHGHVHRAGRQAHLPDRQQKAAICTPLHG
jgi:hypothetical protein